jgi:hypothetical protein
MHNWVSAHARIGLLASCLVLAGVRGADAQLLGYGVGGLAGVSGFFGSLAAGHVAGGGEALVRGRAGVGGALGLIGNLAVGSVNGVFHVVPSRVEHRVSPFVTSGWTRMGNRDRSFDAWNIGGGVDVWSRERVGLRVEFSDHLRPDSRGAVHYWTIRGGVVFRRAGEQADRSG